MKTPTCWSFYRLPACSPRVCKCFCSAFSFWTLNLYSVLKTPIIHFPVDSEVKLPTVFSNQKLYLPKMSIHSSLCLLGSGWYEPFQAQRQVFKWTPFVVLEYDLYRIIRYFRGVVFSSFHVLMHFYHSLFVKTFCSSIQPLSTDFYLFCKVSVVVCF